MLNKKCSVCETDFTCGITQSDQSCWCDSLPAIMPADFIQGCRCRSCLINAIVERIEQTIDINGPDKMVKIASQYRNRGDLIEHIDFTIEDGNYVFSRWYHLKRGACCGNGCRNCPYSKLVPRPIN